MTGVFQHDIGIVRSRRDRRSGERLHRVSSAEVRGRSTVEEDRVGADGAVLDVEGRLVLYLDVQVRLVGVAGVADLTAQLTAPHLVADAHAQAAQLHVSVQHASVTRPSATATSGCPKLKKFSRLLRSPR